MNRREFAQSLAAAGIASVSAIEAADLNDCKMAIFRTSEWIPISEQKAIISKWEAFCERELGRKIPAVVLDGGMDLSLVK